MDQQSASRKTSTEKRVSFDETNEPNNDNPQLKQPSEVVNEVFEAPKEEIEEEAKEEQENIEKIKIPTNIIKVESAGISNV